MSSKRAFLTLVIILAETCAFRQQVLAADELNLDQCIGNTEQDPMQAKTFLNHLIFVVRQSLMPVFMLLREYGAHWFRLSLTQDFIDTINSWDIEKRRRVLKQAKAIQRNFSPRSFCEFLMSLLDEQQSPLHIVP